MLQQSYILLGLIAGLQIGLSSCFLFGPIDRISDRLANKVPSEDVDETLRAASLWLSDLKVGKGSAHDMGLTSSLETFVKLETVLKSKRCDTESYNLIDDVDRLTGGRIFSMKIRRARLVELITRKVAQEHAVACHREHIATLESKYAQMNAKNLKRVKYLESFDRFHYETHLPEDVCQLKRLDDSQLDMLLKQYLEELSTLAANNPELYQFRHSNDDKKVGQLVDQFIIEPCREYVNTTSDLNELATRDAKHMRPVTDNFFAFTRSPFETAGPMLCLCRLYLDRGSQEVTRSAESILPGISYYNNHKD